MSPLLIIVGLFALYELLTAKKSAGSGTATTSATVPYSPATPIVQKGQPVAAPIYTLVPPTATGPGLGTSAISAGIGTGAMIGSEIAQSAGSSLASAIPIVGAVAGAIFSALMAASAKRAAEARSENQAVANEIPQWDAAIAQIVNAYNQGTITADEVYQGLACPQTRQQNVNQYPNGPVWRAYWNVVAPQVQPGRNACQSGAAPHQPPLTHCSGSYGAGCCVAYDDLDNGQLYVVWAIQKAEQQPGASITSNMIPAVLASKYGGVNRAGYTVTVRKPVSSTIPL